MIISNIPGGPIVASTVVIVILLWVVLLRPRRGNCKDTPPLVIHAKNNIPFIGTLVEFFSSPNTMVQRCYNDFGPIFTIPVRYFYPVVKLAFGYMYFDVSSYVEPP